MADDPEHLRQAAMQRLAAFLADTRGVQATEPTAEQRAEHRRLMHQGDTEGGITRRQQLAA